MKLKLISLLPLFAMTLSNYSASIGTLPLFYNQDSKSETAEGLIAGIQEIFDYVKTVEP